MLVAASPLMLIATIGILIASPGPIFYRSMRAGKDGHPFVLYKLRTMHFSDGTGVSITALNDPRIFPLGKTLRKYKIDELPQLFNVLKGDMSAVGPRPEALDIVAKHYSEWDRETLRVRPGLTSPGAIYYYTDLQRRLGNDDAESVYVERVLPDKLAVERVYVENASFWYDMRIIVRTAIAILKIIIGRNTSLRPPELDYLEGKWNG
ncbi:MAG: sugar transferase [Alphaproteobacteria bacterium]|nr:sugar transferase [Alphaproteobacteria bacterium]